MENQKNNDEIEIDLLELLSVLLGRIWLIISVGIFCGAGCFAISRFILTPVYESSTRIYILNKTESQTVTYSDVQLGTQLTKDYAELINSRYVLEEVIQKLSLDMEYKDLLRKVSVDTPADTRIVSITVEDTDPVQAMGIANCIRQPYPECNGYRGSECGGDSKHAHGKGGAELYEMDAGGSHSRMSVGLYYCPDPVSDG